MEIVSENVSHDGRQLVCRHASLATSTDMTFSIFLPPQAEEAAKLRSQGFDFYDWGEGEIRFVTSWDQQSEAVDQLAAAIRAL